MWERGNEKGVIAVAHFSPDWAGTSVCVYMHRDGGSSKGFELCTDTEDETSRG